MTKSEIKDLLQSILLKHCNMSYISNIKQIDVNNWGFYTFNSAKAFEYENIELSIVCRFANVEDYLSLSTKQFYDDLDNVFADRFDNFNNSTLDYIINLKVKTRL